MTWWDDLRRSNPPGRRGRKPRMSERQAINRLLCLRQMGGNLYAIHSRRRYEILCEFLAWFWAEIGNSEASENWTRARSEPRPGGRRHGKRDAEGSRI